MPGYFAGNQGYVQQYGSPYQYPQPSMASWQQPQGGYSQQRPQNNLLKVTGPESAKAYPLPPNSEVCLFDAENPVFYVKTTDSSGYPSLRTFQFEEVQQQVVDVQPVLEQMDTSGFATKEDMESLRTDIMDLKDTLKGLI